MKKIAYNNLTRGAFCGILYKIKSEKDFMNTDNKKNTFQPWECIKLIAQLTFTVFGMVFLVGVWIILAGQAWDSYFQSLIK